jgi:MerR family transcriptional regulator, heat shock protein HspR
LLGKLQMPDKDAPNGRPRRAARSESSENLPLPSEPVSIGLDKPIYTLSVAAEILDAHPRTLMMYEHLDLIKPHRTSTNRRRYSQRDLMKLQAIQTLTRKHRVNLAGARLILTTLRRLQMNGLPSPTGLQELDVRDLDV